LLESTLHGSGEEDSEDRDLGVLSNDDWKFHSNELIIEIFGFENITSELI
jgi:hypothetical protein